MSDTSKTKHSTNHLPISGPIPQIYMTEEELFRQWQDDPNGGAEFEVYKRSRAHDALNNGPRSPKATAAQPDHLEQIRAYNNKWSHHWATKGTGYAEHLTDDIKADQELRLLIDQLTKEARIKSYQAIYRIHMAHEWNETSEDLRAWLKSERHDLDIGIGENNEK